MTDPGSKSIRVHQFWGSREQDIFMHIYMAADRKMHEWESMSLKAAFIQMQAYCNWRKKKEAEDKLTNQAIEVLKNSQRGQRTTYERDILKKFLLTSLTCIPYDKLASSDIDRLSNEVDWVPFIGRSILFLQGDFGNVYYMIAKGSVALYLESSKDQEMVIAREFGHLRGQPYNGTDEDLLRLGIKILVLKTGAGFGEYAILNAKQKLRSCAAVACESTSMLLILHADTYDAVLRKLHNRQRQVTMANALLQELPLFKQYGFSKISSIAYTLKSINFSSKSVIARAGEPFTKVFLIVSGEVRVVYPQNRFAEMHEGHRSKGIIAAEKRLPSLAFAQIGRGFIIGESEARSNSPKFLMNYNVISAECEVFEMPLAVYMDVITSTEQKNVYLHDKLVATHSSRESSHGGRINRAYHAMKDMILQTVNEIDAKSVLMTVLPTMLDENTYNKSVQFGSSVVPNTQRTVAMNSSSMQYNNTSNNYSNYNNNTISTMSPRQPRQPVESSAYSTSPRRPENTRNTPSKVMQSPRSKFLASTEM